MRNFNITHFRIKYFQIIFSSVLLGRHRGTRRVHVESLIRRQWVVLTSPDNMPAFGTCRHQRSVSRSFMVGERSAERPPEQPGRIAAFQAQIGIRHPHADNFGLSLICGKSCLLADYPAIRPATKRQASTNSADSMMIRTNEQPGSCSKMGR